MKLLCERNDVLNALAEAQREKCPLFCPNAESPEEVQGVLAAAEHFARTRGLKRVTIGLGITGSYPEHPQLRLLELPPALLTESVNASEPLTESAPVQLPQSAQIAEPSLIPTAHWWLDTIGLYAKEAWFPRVAVIPFYDHGWVPNQPDRELLADQAFQERMGIIMFDASAFDLEENIRLTSDYVRQCGGRVLVEACPDKILSRAQRNAAGAAASQTLTDPALATHFVRSTGVDLIVPSLGTEHRGEPGTQIRYRSKLAKEIAAQVGPILALHGTSSLGGRLGSVGTDGICKVNFYTAMAVDASRRLQSAWQSEQTLQISSASGGNVFRIRRDACTQTCLGMLEVLHSRL